MLWLTILSLDNMFGIKMKKLLDDTKEYFYSVMSKSDDVFSLIKHVPEVERWVKKINEFYPNANLEIILFGVWLHDVAHYSVSDGEDHAVKSVEMATQFLAGKIDSPQLDQICHCIRSHRCKNVLPETLEAKILACADSASHMTGIVYMDMLTTHQVEDVLAKLERDYRDVSVLPEVKRLLYPIYHLWINMLTEYQKLNLSKGNWHNHLKIFNSME